MHHFLHYCPKFDDDRKSFGYDDNNITTELLLYGDETTNETTNIKLVRLTQSYIYKSKRFNQ